MNTKIQRSLRNAGMGLLAFAFALAIWLPCLHFFFRKPVSDFYQENGISPKARQLAARQTAATLGFIHLLLYVAFMLLVPVSLITAGLLLLWDKWSTRSRAPDQAAHVRANLVKSKA